MVILAMTGLLEIPCGSIWIMDNEFIGRVTVECDAIFSLNPNHTVPYPGRSPTRLVHVTLAVKWMYMYWQCTEYFVGGDNLQIHQWWTDCPEGPIPAVDVPHVEFQYGFYHG